MANFSLTKTSSVTVASPLFILLSGYGTDKEPSTEQNARNCAGNVITEV